jgi:hypothetical protein
MHQEAANRPSYQIKKPKKIEPNSISQTIPKEISILSITLYLPRRRKDRDRQTDRQTVCARRDPRTCRANGDNRIQERKPTNMIMMTVHYQTKQKDVT